MTENGAKPAGDAAAAGIPYYEKQRAHLKELIARRRTLEKRITNTEDSIYQKETEYLENTPSGNIITGFDNYTKGTGNAANARRKTGLSEANRVFSRSSISYNANSVESTSGNSTPANSHAPTPLSTSFAGGTGGGSGSGAPTPTSATAGKAAGKKVKKNAGRGEDSETDGREAKKVRTNFGGVRK
ncbi:hypothetical protein OQA88_3618 [Cercophora sp. LCS_1]